jgi:MFS family permease
MKLNGWPLLAGAMLAVAVGQILFHWLLGRGVFPWLLAVYLAPDAGGKFFFGGVMDNIAPAILLGWVNGWAGYRRWSVRTLCLTTFALAVFVVALMPLYRPLIGPEHFKTVWGSPGSVREAVSSYTFRVVSAFLITGFFTRAAYIFRREWKPRTS